MSIGSPSLTSARSRPAKATARGSHSAPSSNETLSGSLWSHWAGCKCLVRGQGNVSEVMTENSPSGQGTVVWRCAEEHDVRAYQGYQRTFRGFS